MKFKVSEEVFEKLENVCFGVVVAKGIDNKIDIDKINNLLDENMKKVEDYFKEKKVKESLEMLPYREAFKVLAINPNKFMSSIEAMTSRVAKGNKLPNINPVVDLGNSVSLKYLVPMGAHDLNSNNGDVCVRFSTSEDKFVPFGQSETEILDAGELIYSVGDTVKTRRWIWRQGEVGKVTNESCDVFFPIDGFKDANLDKVLGARDELANLLREIFNCEVTLGFIDKDNREMEI